MSRKNPDASQSTDRGNTIVVTLLDSNQIFGLDSRKLLKKANMVIDHLILKIASEKLINLDDGKYVVVESWIKKKKNDDDEEKNEYSADAVVIRKVQKILKMKAVDFLIIIKS